MLLAHPRTAGKRMGRGTENPDLGWDGMGWDGMGWDGMGWDGMGWDGMGWDGMGWDGMGWDGMGWDGMGWDGMGKGDRLAAKNPRRVFQIIAMVKPFRAQAVLAALESVDDPRRDGPRGDGLRPAEEPAAPLPGERVQHLVPAQGGDHRWSSTSTTSPPRSRRSSARRGPAGSATARS